MKLSLEDLEPHEYMKLLVLRRYGSLQAWAKHLGITPTVVSAVLNGTERPSARMLGDLGLERCVFVQDRSLKAKIQAFFESNPDEELTQQEMVVKWNAHPRTVSNTLSKLKKEGLLKRIAVYRYETDPQ